MRTIRGAVLAVRVAVLAIVAAWPVVGLAQVGADQLGLSFPGALRASQGKLALTARPQLAFQQVKFDCDRSDGQKVSFSAGGLKPGRETKIPIPQGKGVYTWKCVVSGQSGKDKFANFQMEFDTKLGEIPKIQLSPADIDEERRRITVRLSEAAGKLELDVMGDDGKPIDNVAKEFHGEAPGTPLVIEWKQAADQVMGNFNLRAYDPAGFWNGIRSVTFVDIPHEDVVFESGKWDIRPSEEPKLQAPLAKIQENLKKVEGVLQVSLYIGGYTDTVGKPDDNVELSRKRAHAIASWFAAHGIQTPILAQGFGEAALKVPTPDNTDEPRNRRASYVLATQPPPANRGFPARNWVRAR